MSHGALPLKEAIATPDWLHRAASVFQSLFDGTSAVMLFFIVSGFCIHLPYTNTGKLPIVQFIVRRYVRIGGPLLAILLIMEIVGGEASIRGHEVLWSIYAELIYYTIYPLFFGLAKRCGWLLLIAISSVVTLVIATTHLRELFLWQLGSLTWLWGLPVWLSGCALAQSFRTHSLANVHGAVWFWRLAAWALGAASTFALFHSPVPIGYPISMIVFAVFAFFWLSRELQDQSPAWRLLEELGKCSYSLYLVHNVVLGGIADLIKERSPIVAIALPWAAIAVATYIFYKLIEAPSHRIARHAASVATSLVSGNRAKP